MVILTFATLFRTLLSTGNPNFLSTISMNAASATWPRRFRKNERGESLRLRDAEIPHPGTIATGTRYEQGYGAGFERL